MDIGTIVALVAAVFGSTGFWTWMINRGNKKSAQAKLILGIAYDKIIWQCEKHIANGFIPAGEFNELNRYLFEPYEAMGGNGTAKKLMAEVRELPSQKEEK